MSAKNVLPIVVYRSNRPDMLLGRFALFGDARTFVDAHNACLLPESGHRAVAFDTAEWRQAWPRSEGGA
jgi:hypothetical protein